MIVSMIFSMKNTIKNTIKKKHNKMRRFWPFFKKHYKTRHFWPMAQTMEISFKANHGLKPKNLHKTIINQAKKLIETIYGVRILFSTILWPQNGSKMGPNGDF